MSERLTEREVETLRIIHGPGAYQTAGKCACCLEPWPCQKIRLLDERAEMEAEVARLRDLLRWLSSYVDLDRFVLSGSDEECENRRSILAALGPLPGDTTGGE